MDAEFGKWLGTLGVGGAIAGILAMFYHRLAQSHAASYVELTERWEKIVDRLDLLVRENTVAFTQSIQMLQTMQKQIDRWDGVERRENRRRPGL
jgi:hypothetical protein